MNAETLSSLQEAMASGRRITIRYIAGSTPGAQRDITPIRLSGDFVDALCHRSGIRKSFALDKIQLPCEEQHNPLAQLLDHSPGTIAEVAALATTALSDLGWVVRSSDSEIALYGTFKNGKQRKTPSVTFSYEEFSTEGYFDGISLQEIQHKRARPWSVRAKERDTRALGALSKAMFLFFQYAYELSPMTRD